jgi:hypothetical protein
LAFFVYGRGFFLSLSSSAAAALSSAGSCAPAHFAGLFRASAALLNSYDLGFSLFFGFSLDRYIFLVFSP